MPLAFLLGSVAFVRIGTVFANWQLPCFRILSIGADGRRNLTE